MKKGHAKHNQAKSTGGKNSQKAGIEHNGKHNGKHSGKHGLHATKIELPAKVRSEVIHLLNQTLADTLDLQTQIKQAHWNVKGIHFYQLHLLFDEIAEEVEDFVDLIAERITTLGGTAMGTVRMAAKQTRLPEYPGHINEGIDHVEALSERFAQYGGWVRENIDECDHLADKDTADIYTEISRDIDKRLWFLEAHLQGEQHSSQASSRKEHARAVR